MNGKELSDLAVRGLMSPKNLWEDKLHDERDWTEVLKFPIVVFVSIIAVFSAVMIMIFGYQIPFMGVIKPSMLEIVIQAIGTVVLYVIPISIMSWVAAYLAGMTGGRNDQNRAIWMLFLVSVPSLIGQALGTVPMVGMFLALGLGIYSMVLFYKAIPVFMEVPLEKRLRYFIFLILASIVVSLVVHFTIGQVFQPSVSEMTNIDLSNFELTK